MWVKLNNFFQEELFNNFNELRNGEYNYETICDYLITQQIDQLPEIAYNKDIYAKYIAQGRRYLHMLHGNDKAHLLRWIYNRFLYVDSLFLQQNSPYTKQSITIRSNCPDSGPAVENLPSGVRYRPTFYIETYVPQYVTICWRKNTYVTQRVGWGETVAFTYDMVNSTDNELIVYCANNLKRIGDCTDKKPTSIDIGSATKLVEFKCNDSDVLLKADLSKNTYLKTVDFKGCSNLGNTTGGANVLDISSCTNLRTIDLRGTSITSVLTNVNGGNVEEILYSEKTESVVLLNQTNLRVVGLPADPIDSLTNVQITNCDNIETLKYPYVKGEPITFDSIKRTQSLLLDNALFSETINFTGFNKLANITLRNMLQLTSIGFDDMLMVNEDPTLKTVTINNCPQIKTLTMNVSDANHVVAFNDAVLDLRYATSIKRIEANGPLVGLNSLYIPNATTDIILKHEFNTNISSDLTGIYSIDGVDDSRTDGFIGFNPLNVVLKNVDLSSAKKIVNSRNMNIEVENDFVIQGNRDGILYPYLKYDGRVDLSNFKGSYAGAFKNWDLSKVQFVYSRTITQDDFTSTFEGAIFSDVSKILPMLERIESVKKSVRMFAKSNITQPIFPPVYSLTAFAGEMFAGCEGITQLGDEIVLPLNIANADGMFKDCINLTEAHLTINDQCSSMMSFFEGCRNLTNIDGLVIGRTATMGENWLKDTSLISADNIEFRPTAVSSTSKLTFEGCTMLQHVLNLKYLANSTSDLFSGCTSLTDVSFAPGSTSNSLMHQNMFRNCKSLVNCDLSNLDTSKSIRFESMFFGCHNLISAPVKYIPKNNLFTTMYYQCYKIPNFDGFYIDTNTVNNGNLWNLDCRGCKSARNMTIKAKTYFGKWPSNAGTLPIESFEGITIGEEVTDISRMFQQNTYLKEDIVIPPHITNADSAFEGCSGMTSIHANWNNTYNGTISAQNCYLGCRGITTIDGNPGTLSNVPAVWGGDGVISTLTELMSLPVNGTKDSDGRWSVPARVLNLEESLKSSLNDSQIQQIVSKNYVIA